MDCQRQIGGSDSLPGLVHSADVVLRIGVPLIGGSFEPAQSFRWVNRNALTKHITRCQSEFAILLTLVGGHPVPFHGLRIVGWNESSAGKNVAEHGLCRTISQF